MKALGTRPAVDDVCLPSPFHPPQYPNASTSWEDDVFRCGQPTEGGEGSRGHTAFPRAHAEAFPSPPTTHHLAYPRTGRGCLFNIFDDPTEHNDIAATNPDVVAALQARITAAQKTAFTPNRGTDDGTACTAALNKWGGFWGPFVA